MRWSYDRTIDALYVYLADGEATAQQELDDGTVVDVAADGSLIGIEVLGLRAGWYPDEVGSAFGLPHNVTTLLRTLVQAITGNVMSVEPGQDRRLASSAAPMPTLVPA